MGRTRQYSVTLSGGIIVIALFFAPLLGAPSVVLRADTTRVVRYEFTVAATPARVWQVVSTQDGLRSWFSPRAEIELKLYGKFNIFYRAEAPERSGGQNMVLSFEPERMLNVTWDAPPKFPNVRQQRTFFQILLSPEGTDRTRVVFQESGFGSSGDWEGTYHYFQGAWPFVAACLQYRFEVGPIDWTHPPDLMSRLRAIGGDVAVQWATHRSE
jgi:uncharacterized protein YndB with AHSA1/START domain